MQATDLAHQAFITVGLYNYAFTAQTQPMNLVTDPLQTITVSPKDIQIMYPDTGHIEAFGAFLSGLLWEHAGAGLTFTFGALCALAGGLVFARGSAGETRARGGVNP